jgi:hypothetical protein
MSQDTVQPLFLSNVFSKNRELLGRGSDILIQAMNQPIGPKTLFIDRLQPPIDYQVSYLTHHRYLLYLAITKPLSRSQCQYPERLNWK